MLSDNVLLNTFLWSMVAILSLPLTVLLMVFVVTLFRWWTLAFGAVVLLIAGSMVVGMLWGTLVALTVLALGVAVLVGIIWRQRALRQAETHRSDPPPTTPVDSLIPEDPKPQPLYTYLPLVILATLGIAFLWDVGWFDGRVFIGVVGLSVVGFLYTPTREPTIGLLFVTAAILCVVGVLLWSFGSYEPSLWQS